ncbi:MAG: LysR substrate-binding domain-containing protein, partial [Myxococcota bacterium]
PTQPDLVAKKVKEVPAWLYATPAYLAELGNPQVPADLARADFIAFDRTDATLRALNGLGLSLTRRNFPMMSENHLVIWELVKQGVAVGIMSEDIGDAERAVVRALPDLAPINVPLWLTAHRDVHTSRRVRMVYNLLASELAA